MAQSFFFEKKECFERGVSEVRFLLKGRDVATLPRRECALFAEKYENLEKLARELCELSRTSASKEQYASLATRLGERAHTLRLLASGKSKKATPDERRANMLAEFEKHYQDIKKRLRSRKIEDLSGAECEALAKKYEKLATLAKGISAIARTDADIKKYGEFYEKLMCRVAELSALARKKSGSQKKKTKSEDAPEKQSGATHEKKADTPRASASSFRDERAEKAQAYASLSLSLSSDYARMISLVRDLSASAIHDSEREEYEYLTRYLTESAEFYEAVIKKEIKTLSPDEILSLETK